MVTEFIGNGTTYKDKATGMWRSEVRFLDENGKKHKKVFSARTSEESAQRAQAFRNQADPNSHYEDTTVSLTALNLPHSSGRLSDP